MDNHEIDPDGIDRRGFLKCMAWAGTGMILTVRGGILKSIPLTANPSPNTFKELAESTFSFVQISDSHVGFSKDANKDVIATLKTAVDRINAAGHSDLLIHTGDISHLSKPDEFDSVDQILQSVSTGQRFYVPGEHDVLNDNGVGYLARYGKGTSGSGWYSFDHKGLHFIGLVNVLNLKAGGLGYLGEDQLAWLAKDLSRLSSSTPIVVFAHMPLWSIYPAWGWGTDDGARALTLLLRFGSVSVLNGHIHQAMQKVEGNITFHTAMSTAFPQPAPGGAASPGPMKVPAEQLASVLGVTHVNYLNHRGPLAIIDSTLTDADPESAQVSIQNFMFAPQSLSISRGTEVVWTNKDDDAHTVAEKDGLFKSQALDTGESYRYRFPNEGTFGYYCSVHPSMQGQIVVK